MGCGSSKNKVTPQEYTKPHPEVKEEGNQKQKQSMLEGCKKNDPFIVKRNLRTMKPQENLKEPGANYTAVHAAAEHNSEDALEVLLAYSKQKEPEKYKTVVNIQDKDGNTPLMKSAQADASDSMRLLLAAGSCSTGYTNAKGETVSKISESQQAPVCKMILEQYNKGQIETAALNVDLESMVGAYPNAESFKKEIDQSTKAYSIIDAAIKNDKPFEDPDFPADPSSISANTESENYVNYFKDAEWLRPHEIFNTDASEVKVFESIEPGDILQGKVGVGYFLASLSAIAEFPSRLQKCFLFSKSNKLGIYSVYFYAMGVRQEIVIDDRFPCVKGEKKPIFSQPSGKEIWVLILEKAWSKLYGSYTQVEHGLPYKAMEYVLGCPTYHFYTKRVDESGIWSTISNADRKNQIIVCKSFKQITDSKGVVPNRSYACISCHEFKDHKIFKMRNPWGAFQWGGEYAETSSKWNDELKREVGFIEKDEGTFYLALSEFKQYFETVHVAEYREKFQHTGVKCKTAPNHAKLFQFEIIKDTEASFRIHQEDIRIAAKQDNADDDQDEEGEEVAEKEGVVKYSPAQFNLCRILPDGLLENVLKDPDAEDDNNQWYGARSIYINKYRYVKLTPGKYLLRAKVHWRDGQEHEFGVSAYASQKINLQETTYPDFWKNYYTTYAQRLTDLKELEGGKVEYTGKYMSKNFYLYLSNLSDQTARVQFDFTGIENLKLGKRYRVSDTEIDAKIPPKGKDIIFLKRINPVGKSSIKWKVNVDLE